MKLKLLLITLFIFAASFAQNKGTVSGIISDKDSNNEALPFANVMLKGTSVGTTTDIEGKYSLNVEAGDHVLVISFVGYETLEFPFTIKANETLEINKTIGSGSVTLQDVVLTTTVNKEKESALLLDQKNAVQIKQSIGAQEMSRKGVSDVATAVTKTTGITKQEGSGNIFVRGLGDRYNSTTMNGLPVPSNDPGKKNLNLEIFTTDIVESIGIDKVYNSKLYGDFAGGNVDIVSKDYKGKGFLKLDVGSKVNTNALSEDDFRLQKGPSSSGFSNVTIPSNALTSYKFNSLQTESKNPIAGSFNLAGGKSFNVGEEGKLNLFATVGFDNDYSSRSDGTAKGGVNGSGVINRDYQKYTLVSYNTNTTAMGNVGYKINANNKLNFNTLFINTSGQSTEEYTGYIVDIANDGNGLIRRFKYDKNSLWINQLLGDHQLSERSKLNWGVSYNTITGKQPDRAQNTFRKEPTGYVLSSISAADNHRYFQNLKEDELAVNASVDYKIVKTAEGDYKGKITVGYSGRSKKRDFEATQFNFKASSAVTNTIVDPNNLDLFYNQQNFANDYFEISTFKGGSQVPNATKPQFYNGDLMINGGYVNTEYKFNKLSGVLGLRAESIIQKVAWNTSLDPNGDDDQLDKFAFLPSLTLKYELNEKQNLRFGFSKTYTLPQFKERALFVYEEVNEAKFGNPDLYASDDYNVDIKWEMFPKSEELISFTAFGKYIQNPINEVTILSSTNDVSYINTGDYGYVAGGEVEYRKQIFNFGESNAKKLSAGINASYLYTNQKLSDVKVAKETAYNVAFTEKETGLTGASDLLLNADISYLNEWNEKQSNFMTTLAYTYFSDRIYSIGTNDMGNQVDKAFGSLDFIAKSKLNKQIGLGLVVKNILDPTINRVQENNSGDVNVLSYKKGLTLSLNINYQF
ncbi:MAG: TonB-dependent receptor [Flavobacterium sp.]|nr:TonB-dependent receptor [Flavobacterium sp.]